MISFLTAALFASIFQHLKLELLTQLPASLQEIYISMKKYTGFILHIE